MIKDTDILRIKQRFSIIGNAPALNNAISRALQVAPIDLSVLILGESGAGKEVFRKSSTPTAHASTTITSP